MEIRDDIVSKKLIYADELEIGECFKYIDHIYLKANVHNCESRIIYVDLTDNMIYPEFEFKETCVDPIKAYVQIEYHK